MVSTFIAGHKYLMLFFSEVKKKLKSPKRGIITHKLKFKI